MTKNVGFREIIFSVNCFIAVMLALYIAFRLELKNPWWAMVTVYLTSQPLSGALRARAVYRILGTLLGGIAMLVIVPNLADAPELMAAAIVLWIAFCLYLGLLDRSPRAYASCSPGTRPHLSGSQACSIRAACSTQRLPAWRRSCSAPCRRRWCTA